MLVGPHAKAALTLIECEFFIRRKRKDILFSSLLNHDNIRKATYATIIRKLYACLSLVESYLELSRCSELCLPDTILLMTLCEEREPSSVNDERQGPIITMVHSQI